MFADEMDKITMNAISSKIHQTNIQMQIPLVIHGKTVTKEKLGPLKGTKLSHMRSTGIARNLPRAQT